MGLGDAGEARRETLEKPLKPASLMPKQEGTQELRSQGPLLKGHDWPRPHSKPVKLGLQTALRLPPLPPLQLVRAKSLPTCPCKGPPPQTPKTKTENENKGDRSCKSRDPPACRKDRGRGAKESWSPIPTGGMSALHLGSRHVAFASFSFLFPEPPLSPTGHSTRVHRTVFYVKFTVLPEHKASPL